MENNNAKIHKMANESILKIIFYFGLPSILSALVYFSYSIVDGIFIGRKLGEIGLASISIFSPLSLALNCIGLLISVGGTTLFSMKLGDKKEEEAKNIMQNTILFGSIFALIVVILLNFFKVEILRLIGNTELTESLTLEYGSIYINYYFILFIAGLLNSHITCIGYPTRSQVHSIASCIANIIMDYVFVIVLDMGVKGAAYATVLSWVVYLMLTLIFYIQNSSNRKWINIRDFKLNISSYPKVIKFGMPLFLMQIGYAVFNGIFINNIKVNSILAGYTPESILSISTSIFRVTSILLVPAINFPFGNMPVISYFYGAKNFDKLKSLLFYLVIISIIGTSILYIPAMIFAKPLLSIFGLSNEIIELGARLMRIFSFAYIIVGYECTVGSYFQGTGKFIFASIISSARSIIVGVISLLLITKVLSPTFGFDPIIASFYTGPTIDIVLFILSFILYNYNKKRA